MSLIAILDIVFVLASLPKCDISSRDFSVWRLFSIFESIGLGLEIFGLEKKSRYRSRKYLVSKKSIGIGLENIWSQKKVSVSVSKIFGLEKRSRYRSRKYLVSKKSLGLGLEN